MEKFVYKNKKTGEKVTSKVPLNNKDLVLVSQVKDGKIKKEFVKIK